MFDWFAVYLRFFEACEVRRSSELARLFGVTKQTAYSWKAGKSHVPWRRMKTIADMKNVKWEWLLEGLEPKHGTSYSVIVSEDFVWDGINQRFLDLFPNKSQEDIGQELGVAQETVSKWHRVESHVPWEKLKYAHDTYKVTWDWLITGEN